MALSTFEDPDEKRKVNEGDPDFQNDEPEITLIESLEGAKNHPVVTVDISSIFAPIIDEPRDLAQNSKDALKKLLWMWWNDPEYPPSQKFLSDCFGSNPALYYYALKHFSDTDLDFSDDERTDLSRQLRHHVGCLISGATSNVFPLPDNRSLEFCWYFLVRLLTIEDQVRSLPESPKKEEHLSLLHEQYASVIHYVHDAKRNGHITIPSLFDWLEERLLHLGKDYPHLRPLSIPLLQKDILDTSSKTVSDIQRAMWDQYMVLFAEEQDKEGGWEKDKIIQDNIAQLLFRLRTSLIPKNGEKAWHQPLDFILECAKDKKVVCVDQAYTRGLNAEGELDAVDQIELALLNRFSSDEGTIFIFADAQVYVCPLHDLLEEQGNPQSLADIMATVEQYVNGKTGEYSLQTFLRMEGDTNPYVQDCFLYWAAVREACQKKRMLLINDLLPGEHDKILKVVQSAKKTIILGSGNTAPILAAHDIASDDMLVIHHQPAPNGYPDDHVCIPHCLGYVAHELGNKNGWGDFDSSAVFLHNHHALMDAISQKDTESQMAEFLMVYTFPVGPHEWVGKDIILFTKCDDDDDGASLHSPVHSDSYVPVGSP